MSPLLTAAQYLVDTLDLPAPRFDAAGPGDGAEDPEAAVRGLLEGAGAADGQAVGDLVGGGAGDAVRAYASPLEGLVGRGAEDLSVEIDTLDTKVRDREAGGQQVEVNRLEGTLSYTEEGEDRTATVTWDGTCFDTQVSGGDEEIGGDGELDVGSSDFCLTDGWRRVGIDSLSVAVVEEDGGWRVDPLATLTDYAGAMAPKITAPMVLRTIGYPEVAEPTGDLPTGSPTDVELNDAGFAVLTVDVEADQPFTITADAESEDQDVDSFLVAPDGSYESTFSLIEPSEAGQYLLVVATEAWAPGTLSVRRSQLIERDLTLGEATSGGIGQPGDIVRYSVDLEADTGYQLTYDDTDLSYSVLDPDDVQVDLQEGGDGGTSFTTDAAGTYAVVVDGGSSDATGSFQITLEAVEAFVLGTGTSDVATGAIAAPGDAQFIDLTVQGGREVVVDLAPDDAALDLVFIVKDPDTDTEIERFDSGGPGQPESVSIAPDETTTYRIEVQGADGTVGSFTLTAAVA